MIEIVDLTFRYPGKEEPVFAGLQFHLQRGETLLVSGSSGCGKSTFLRTLNGLVPHFSGGRLSGRVTVNGLDAISSGPAVMSQQVGFVFQDPESQFVMDVVEDELAFGMENAAIPTKMMSRRIGEVLEMLGIQHLKSRRLESLSGGEKQKVAIAAALVLQPPVLVLDEPTSQLDAQSAEELLQAFVTLKEALGLTMVIAEHRLERLLSVCDRMLVLNGDPHGWISGEPRTVLMKTPLLPPMVELARRIGYQPLPITLEEGMRMADSIKLQPWGGKSAKQEAVTDRHVDSPSAIPFLELRSLSVNYGNTRALKEINLTVREGEMAAVIGRNGAGKTSLLRAIMGLVQPARGEVFLCGEEISAKAVWERSRQIGYLPQDPNALLFADRVFDELEITLRNYGLSKPRAELMGLLEQLGIARYAEEYPRDLSVGERQRVALAAILVMQPRLLLLDEPTRGLDYFSKKQLVEMLSDLNHRGLTLMVVTHDVEFMAQFAQRVIWLEDGEVIADGDPREILLRNSSFQPQMLQLFGEKRCLTVGDVVDALETQESSAVVLS